MDARASGRCGGESRPPRAPGWPPAPPLRLLATTTKSSLTPSLPRTSAQKLTRRFCDGNSDIDYTCGYGPVILGHGYPSVVHAVHEAAARGMLFGGQHEAEVQLAELLRDLVPCIDMVRSNRTGSEAVAAAVRLARAY